MAQAFGPLRSHGETQLQIQYTLLSMYATQTMGILALNAALLAVVIAAEDFLGRYWWLALIGLVLSSWPCVLALGGHGEEFGPKIDELAEDAESLEPAEMDRVIFESIAWSVAVNQLRLDEDRRLIVRAMVPLGITIFGAILAVVVF